MIKIKVIEGDESLKGKILNLIQTDDMVYICENTGIRLIDTWQELEEMKKYSTERHFFDMHLFSDSFKDLQFITEIECNLI